jgi:hypothetical protein
MDKMLEEQIARMKLLNERLAEVHRGVTDATQAVVRQRQIGSRGPLDDVRDYRIVESHEHDAVEAPAARRGGKAAHPSRKRRRR